MPITKSKLSAWAEAEAALGRAKATELALRLEICKEVLAGKPKGVAHLIVDGFDVAATAKINTKIDKEVLDTIWPSLSQTEKESVRFKPEIVAKQYGFLDAKSNLHQAVITTPGTPSLEIKPIKEK